jgi:hypothetical protein
MDRVFFKGTL